MAEELDPANQPRPPDELDSKPFKDVWPVVVDLANDALVVLGEFRSRFNLPAGEVDGVIAQAVKLGLLLPVYRLKADENDLEEIGRLEWTEELPELGQVFTRGDGQVIVDGRSPENILVAFRRVRARGGES